MKKVLWGVGVVLGVALLAVPGALFAAVQAGTAADVQGAVMIVSPTDTAMRPLKKGDPVFMGDKIETGADGRLEVKLLDKTVFSLGPSGAISMDEFAYDPKTDEGKVRAGILKGIFRVATGKVAHKRPENMTVTLPAGTIGFRGTVVAGIVDGTRSTIILLGPVEAGRIYVTNLVNGQLMTLEIDETGMGVIVDGPDSTPYAVQQVSEAELLEIAEALGLSLTQLTGGSQSGVPNFDILDSQVQSEETARDISPVSEPTTPTTTTTSSSQESSNDIVEVGPPF
ncbi:MAG: FecR domain-containing protein [Candidatus Omnitrophica bacterium]|nr:FecR domain-containing protein [Candidatus Omnitrophota bacterium]